MAKDLMGDGEASGLWGAGKGKIGTCGKCAVATQSFLGHQLISYVYLLTEPYHTGSGGGQEQNTEAGASGPPRLLTPHAAPLATVIWSVGYDPFCFTTLQNLGAMGSWAACHISVMGVAELAQRPESS